MEASNIREIVEIIMEKVEFSTISRNFSRRIRETVLLFSVWKTLFSRVFRVENSERGGFSVWNWYIVNYW